MLHLFLNKFEDFVKEPHCHFHNLFILLTTKDSIEYSAISEHKTLLSSIEILGKSQACPNNTKECDYFCHNSTNIQDDKFRS